MRVFISIAFIFLYAIVFSQENEQGEFHGNFQLNFQTFRKDTLIEAVTPDEKALMSSFANFTYTYKEFLLGARFESALNPLPGFDSRNNGTGFPFRFASYQNHDIDITAGSFYEQFGNGLIFRSYEDKTIDYDNAMDGIRIKTNYIKSTTLKVIYGRQRDYFGINQNGISQVHYGDGIVRGIDAESNISEFFISDTIPFQISLGGSFVSKFQNDNDPVYILPENVAAYAGRLNISFKNIAFSTELAYKINDPSADNNYIYKNGSGAIMNFSYSKPGFAFLVSAKHIDNMSFRSDRDAVLNRLSINYLPAITRNHVYTLPAMYPYATQPSGEAGFNAEILYKFKSGTLLGGKNGTNISINFSRVNNIKKQPIDIFTPVGTSGTKGYKSSFFSIGDQLYYQDFNLELSKKINHLKTIFSIMHLTYNYNVLKGVAGHENVNATIGIADITWMFKPKHAIRFELQNLQTRQDMNDWAMFLAEYSISPKWFFTVSDLYNYSNINQNLRIHYYNLAFAFVKNSFRLQIGYGKQRQGVVCAGGICRNVPASNGLSVSISGSF